MTKSKQKFTLPPALTEEEKAKKAEEFINLSEKTRVSSASAEEKEKKPIPKQKESVKAIYIRAPESLWQDARSIMNITGLTMNAICLELLRPAIKKKLKELQEDEF